MDGLRFDLDFRITELEFHMRENLGEQLIELKKIKDDISKHLARKQIPIPVKFKLATIISITDSAINLNHETSAMLMDSYGIRNEEDISIYVKYHQRLAELSLKLIELEVLADEILGN